MQLRNVLSLLATSLLLLAVLWVKPGVAQDYDLVVVNGTIVVRESKVLKGVYPGRPIRAEIRD